MTVLEKYEDVVDLVLPSLSGYVSRLDVIVDDVFKWKRPRSLPRFETIYFDIWPDSDVSLLPQMNQLHRRYRPMLAEGGWMDSWTYGMLREKQRNDSRFTRHLPALLEKHRLAQTPEQFRFRLLEMIALAGGSGDFGDEHLGVVLEYAKAKGIEL